MKTRQEISDAIDNNIKEIERLQSDNEALTIENILLCDDVQRFEEKTERHKVGRKFEHLLIGRIHWKEEFIDEDTGESVWVDRSQIVKVNGKWEF